MHKMITLFLFAFLSLPIHGMDYGSYRWESSDFKDYKILFPVPARSTLQGVCRDGYEAVIHQQCDFRGIGISDVYKDITSTIALPEKLPTQLFKDGCNLLCRGKIKNLGSSRSAAELGTRAWLGSRMIALAIGLGADPLLHEEKAQDSLWFAWRSQQAKLVMVLLQKNVPIPNR